MRAHLNAGTFIQRNIRIKTFECFEKAMTPFHCIILCNRRNTSLHVCTLCIGIFTFKMTTEIIYLQDELPIVLITTLDLETFIKGHHVYKDIWTPKQGEQLDVLMEPDNRMDKFAVWDHSNVT